ncbi:MAG: hypothetical protein EOL88_00530 [Bacteroidia bacterium]|nr:hypothetical protein [Bacteroidia bacterium]
MAIKKTEDKSLSPEKKMTRNSNRAIIETKERDYCFPEHGVTVKASSPKEANKKLKELLNK